MCYKYNIIKKRKSILHGEINIYLTFKDAVDCPNGIVDYALNVFFTIFAKRKRYYYD